MDSPTRALLTRVLNDPSFRNWLQTQPVDALADVGLVVDAATVPSVISLPTDDEIRAMFLLDPNLDDLKACMAIFHLITWQSN